MEYVLLMHGHTRSILIEKFFNIFIFSAVGTCVAAHWNENYIKIMCKYNNQVNMKRLFWQALSSLCIHSLYHFVQRFFPLLCALCLLAFSFSGEHFLRGRQSLWRFFASSVFQTMMLHFAIAHRVLGFYYLLHCYYYGLISLYFSTKSFVATFYHITIEQWHPDWNANYLFVHISAKAKFHHEWNPLVARRNFITCQLQKYAYNFTTWSPALFRT